MALTYTQARERMVQDQLVARGITDARVLAIMGRVPRHTFVEEYLRNQAYEDYPLPIGENQTISQPYIIAIMAQVLQLERTERILEIGTGSGYFSAILAELGAIVYSVERLESLARRAQATLQSLGYRNVLIDIGDGSLGWPDHAPFDAVVVGSAAPCLPRPLLSQLIPGGRLLLPIGEEELQTLVKVSKEPTGLREDYFGDCRFVKLRGRYGWEH